MKRRNSGWRVLPHTAELVLEIRGASWPSFYRNGALGLLSLCAPLPAGGAIKTSHIHLRADGPEELLVAWLNEIVYLVFSKRRSPGKIRIMKAGENFIEAVLKCGQRPRNAAPLPLEIKAATYHGLKIKQSKGRITAQIILDV